MNSSIQSPAVRRRHSLCWLALAATTLAPHRAHASFLHGEALDSAANFLSWVVICLVPLVGITVFWLVHILPEKIAHKKKHPQTKLIQCLCLMSLVFGGILWPLAWILAYSKPVLHKLAYGTDVDDSHDHSEAPADTGETARLQARVAELEAKLTDGKATI